MQRIRTLVTMHSYESDASFDLHIEGEDFDGLPKTWLICEDCDKGWTDLSDIEHPGTGLMVKKIRFVGDTKFLSICQVLAYAGSNVAFGSSVELAGPQKNNDEYPHIVANSGTL